MSTAEGGAPTPDARDARDARVIPETRDAASGVPGASRVQPAPVVLKIGGTVASDTSSLAALLDELATLARPVVLVHGGGKRVSEVSGALGMRPHFVDGIRMTSPEEMVVVDMVLAGEVNTSLVRAAQRAGIRAVGLTGADAGLITGRIIGGGASAEPRSEDSAGSRTTHASEDSSGSRTARPLRVDPSVIGILLQHDILPVVATVASGEDGGAVNINADDAAQAIAEALPGSTLCYLSDIPGVLGANDAVLAELGASQVEELIATGVARDGMAAKLRSCVQAVARGAQAVVIGQFRESGDLARLLAGRHGTTVTGVTEHG